MTRLWLPWIVAFVLLLAAAVTAAQLPKQTGMARCQPPFCGLVR